MCQHSCHPTTAHYGSKRTHLRTLLPWRLGPGAYPNKTEDAILWKRLSKQNGFPPLASALSEHSDKHRLEHSEAANIKINPTNILKTEMSSDTSSLAICFYHVYIMKMKDIAIGCYHSLIQNCLVTYGKLIVLLQFCYISWYDYFR
jgi:hypothetical protein